MPAPLKSRFNALRGRRNGSREARRVSAVAGNSQKPLQRPPRAAETALEKRERFPQETAPLKSRLNGPRSRQNGSGTARRLSTIVGTSQKPPLRPPRAAETASEKISAGASTTQKPSQRSPEPTKWIRGSEKVFRGSRQLSEDASTPPESRRTGFEDARRFCAVAGNSQKPPLRPPEAAETAPKKREAGTSQKSPRRPPETPRQLRGSEKVFRGSWHL